MGVEHASEVSKRSWWW